MDNHSGPPDAGRERAPAEWRAVCRAAAAEQAAQEAREGWDVADGAPIPFDYRFEHVSQVVGLARTLAEATGADLAIVEAAAWLHDVRKEAPSHGEAGAAAARTILADTDFPPDKVDAVTEAIRVHAGLYRQPDAPPMQPLEAAVLWDADKLSKLGVQAMMTSISSAAAAPRSLAERWRYIAEFVDGVLSRTVRSMNTAPAQAMAADRYRHMVTVLGLWAQEAREAGEDLQGELDLEISLDHAGLSQE